MSGGGGGAHTSGDGKEKGSGGAVVAHLLSKYNASKGNSRITTHFSFFLGTIGLAFKMKTTVMGALRSA